MYGAAKMCGRVTRHFLPPVTSLPRSEPFIHNRARPESLPTIVADRLAEGERHRALPLPLLMRASELPALIGMAGVSGGTDNARELRGEPVSSGCAEAELVVVHDPGDFGRMKRGSDSRGSCDGAVVDAPVHARGGRDRRGGAGCCPMRRGVCVRAGFTLRHG